MGPLWALGIAGLVVVLAVLTAIGRWTGTLSPWPGSRRNDGAIQEYIAEEEIGRGEDNAREHDPAP